MVWSNKGLLHNYILNRKIVDIKTANSHSVKILLDNGVVIEGEVDLFGDRTWTKDSLTVSLR